MKNYFEGWKDVGEVIIPPVKQKGFRENVLRRRNIDPYNFSREEQESVAADSLMDEDMNPTIMAIQEDDFDETIMLSSEDDCDETVMLSDESENKAYLIRQKTGETFEIGKAEVFIGKSPEMDIVIRENPAVSRQHARILSVQGEYYLEDVGSKNHTYLNGKEIIQMTRLNDDDQIKFADEEFLFATQWENGK